MRLDFCESQRAANLTGFDGNQNIQVHDLIRGEDSTLHADPTDPTDCVFAALKLEATRQRDKTDRLHLSGGQLVAH